jgi:hypothetical protein
MTSTLKRQPDTINGRRVYVTADGRFYAWKNYEWGWSVGRTVDGFNLHAIDVRTLKDARIVIARLEEAS